MTTTDTNNPLGASRWRLQREHSSAEFHVRTYWGLSTVHGHFDRLDGHVADGLIELVLDAASLDTGNGRRDRHLRSADFFDAEHHPQVRFHSTDFEPHGEHRLRVAGELEAAGRRTRIELEPAINRPDADHLELDAETTIDQRRLGMTYRRFGIRTPATIVLHARLCKREGSS